MSSAKLKCPACQLTTSTIFYLQHEIMSRLKSTGKLSPVTNWVWLKCRRSTCLSYHLLQCDEQRSRAGSPASPLGPTRGWGGWGRTPGSRICSLRCRVRQSTQQFNACSLDYRREALKCSDIGQITLLCSSSHCHRSCCAAQKHRVLCEAAPAAVLPFLFIFFLSLRSFLLFQKDYKTIQAAETQPLRSLAFQISLKN